jgi:hypothetical protein
MRGRKRGLKFSPPKARNLTHVVATTKEVVGSIVLL